MRTLGVLLIMTLAMAFGYGAFCQNALETGLRFSSHEVIKDQRTSLNLTPQQPFSFPDGFSLEFEAKFRPGDGHYGNIFRIIGNDQVNIDLVSNLASTSANFWLVLKDQILFSYKWEDIPHGAFGEWMKIRIGIDMEHGMISSSLNGYYQEKKVHDIHALEEFNILFGICKYKTFLNTDVSPMTLNNVVVYDGDGDVFRHWKLAKHSHNKVYDEMVRAEAEVQNPNWEIDKHMHWKKQEQFHFANLLGVVKDENYGRVFFVDDRAVYVYDLDSADVEDTLGFKGGKPFACMGNQMIYNRYTDEIWSYSFDNKQVSKFDFQTQKWSLSEPDCVEPDLWHHNKWISPLDSSLITFGGYGHYTYKSTVHHFRTKRHDLDSLDLGQQIPSRYLSAAGFLDKQKVLVFGGYGSKSGRQELSPEFYYDLYTLDLQDLSVNKRWTLSAAETPFVPCESLLADTPSGSFYTLIYNNGNFETSLRLAKFSIDTPEKRVFADSIPYKFLDTNSWATFFLNQRTSELITLTTHGSAVNVYSLAYPPLFPEEVYQQEKVHHARISIWIVLSTLSIIVISLFFLWRTKFRKGGKPDVEITTRHEVLDHSDTIMGGTPSPMQPKTSTICLLGGFQVFDQQGKDITSDFTPTIKQLFLLILLTTLKNNKGVSSVKLKDTLWFDKSATSARNNRNVSMSKLRGIFDRVGSIELRHDHTYWYIIMGTEIYCDYTHALGLISQSQTSESLQRQEISQLIDIVSRGELCPGLQTEWLDTFKADFANRITDILSSLPYQSAEIRNDHHLLLSISECMLKFDSLHEEAIAMKCSALYNLGKKGLAKHAYDLFCREYEHILGENYLISFSDLLNHPFSHTSSLPNSHS